MKLLRIAAASGHSSPEFTCPKVQALVYTPEMRQRIEDTAVLVSGCPNSKAAQSV